MERSRTLSQDSLTWSARPLELVSTTAAGTGVLICTYRPARR
jgi:hypothetical protein